MHHVQRRLDLLPALDMALAPIAGDRADVVVEGRDEARAARLRDDLLAVRVVAAHDLVVVEKVDAGAGHRAVEPFEAVGPERQALGRRQAARVANRHPAPFHDGALPGAVIAAAVAPGEHLAVAVKRTRR